MKIIVISRMPIRNMQLVLQYYVYVFAVFGYFYIMRALDSFQEVFLYQVMYLFELQIHLIQP